MLVASGRLQAGAVRLAEHALLSAAELLSSGSSPTLLRDVLTQLAALVTDPIQRARYQRLAQAVPVPSRLPVAQAVSPSGPTVGPVAEPVWSWDLLAWESAASPTARSSGRSVSTFCSKRRPGVFGLETLTARYAA